MKETPYQLKNTKKKKEKEKIKELIKAHVENYDNSFIEIQKRGLRKEIPKRNIRNIFANCKEIAELKNQLAKKPTFLEEN